MCKPCNSTSQCLTTFWVFVNTTPMMCNVNDICFYCYFLPTSTKTAGKLDFYFLGLIDWLLSLLALTAASQVEFPLPSCLKKLQLNWIYFLGSIVWLLLLASLLSCQLIFIFCFFLPLFLNSLQVNWAFIIFFLVDCLAVVAGSLWTAGFCFHSFFLLKQPTGKFDSYFLGWLFDYCCWLTVASWFSFLFFLPFRLNSLQVNWIFIISWLIVLAFAVGSLQPVNCCFCLFFLSAWTACR